MQTRTAATRTVGTVELLLRLPALVRLTWRLLRDARVPVWPKAVLAAAVAYVVLPADLLPDALPLLGQVDDAVLIVAAWRGFLRWCPPAVVREHAARLERRPR
jgi:uncharacterized membrane protein YkvA (DUF1232 family)